MPKRRVGKERIAEEIAKRLRKKGGSQKKNSSKGGGAKGSKAKIQRKGHKRGRSLEKKRLN